MRKLCFGGSFNPIHHGHLICAQAAAAACGFEKVVLIPSAQGPHKPCQTDLADADHRVKMCQLVAAGDDSFEVDDLEVRRGAVSYTIDTARELRKRGWEQIHWLIGADMLAMLPQWHEAEALLREVRFVVMGRPGWSIDWSSLPAGLRVLERNVVPVPLIDISATEIRRRVCGGDSIAYLVPPAVQQYIQAHGLYR